MRGGTRWRSRLRHCAGSIPDGVIGRTMALGLTQPLTENEYQEYFQGGEGGRGGQCVWLTTLRPPCTDCPEIWEPQPHGILKSSGPVQACTLLYLIYFMCEQCPKGEGAAGTNYWGPAVRKVGPEPKIMFVLYTLTFSDRT
jgi:hypothetical protein